MAIKGTPNTPLTLGELIEAKDARIAALEAELAPWREMARQIEEMVRVGCDLDLKVSSNVWVGAEAIVDNLPAAVDAVYRQVKGWGMNAEQKEYAQRRDREISEQTIKALNVALDHRDAHIAALEAERDAARQAHAASHEEAADWRRLYTEKLTKVAELELTLSACEDTATEARFAQEQAEAERDAAQAEAAQRWAELRQCVENDSLGLIANLIKNVDRLTGERDAKDHECHRLRNVLNDRNEDLTAAEARAVIAERERDHIKEQFEVWREGMEDAAENTCQERDEAQQHRARLAAELWEARQAAAAWKRHINLYRRFIVSTIGAELHNQTWQDFKERFKDD